MRTAWGLRLLRPRTRWISIARTLGRTTAAAVLLGIFAAPWAPKGPEHNPAAAVPQGDNRFLILGLTQDNRRTDTIEVVQWDAAQHEVRILGIPRDIPFTLPGVGRTKLVDAYATGGAGRARVMVARLLGIPIAHYVVFSLPAMRQAVDLIGGVPLDVEKRMIYTDRQQHLFINLYPGRQILNGAAAEEYLRFRHDSEGDIGRIRRQQHFLRAMAARIRASSIFMRLPALIQVGRKYVQTDLTSSEMLGWLRRVGPLTPGEISSQSIAGKPAVLYDALAHERLDFWAPNEDDLRAEVRWLSTGVPTDPAC
jgi:polyisoprenyl-teichoic acid--peptidoglycan teichoic acid transferase